MVEDIELNALIKDAFESEKAFEFKLPRKESAKRKPFLYVAAPSMLLAASLAMVAMFRVHSPSVPDRVSSAICLLSEAEGVELVDSSSPESLLLAWQEAPLEEILFE